MNDADVGKLNNRFLTASLLAIKHGFEKDWLGNNAVKLLILAAAGKKNL